MFCKVLTGEELVLRPFSVLLFNADEQTMVYGMLHVLWGTQECGRHHALDRSVPIMESIVQ